MKLQGRGVIIGKRLLEENSAIITLFSKESGIYSGVVSKLKAKSGIDIYQVGNLVDFSWNARLASHIGTLRCELVSSYASKLMYDKHKLYSLNSVLSIIGSSLKPHDKHSNLFDQLIIYMDRLVVVGFSFLDYIKMELSILAEAGYGLDISKCCSSGVVEDLIYVSPKSGRAVSRAEGAPYATKLLPLPSFLTSESEPENEQEVRVAFDLTGYFFKRYIFKDGAEPGHRGMLAGAFIGYSEGVS